MSDGQSSGGVIEALLRQAAIDNFYIELDSLPPDEELGKLYTFSHEHDERMRRLFSKERLHDRIRTTTKWGLRAVATIAIALSIVFGALMLVPEVRATVVRTVIEWFDGFVSFTSNVPITDLVNLEPGFIPVGFSEEWRDETDTITVVMYVDEEGMYIIFKSVPIGGLLSVDNENVEHSLNVIAGTEYHVFTSITQDGENHVIWEFDDQRLFLGSSISMEILLRMAVSVGE